MSKLDVNKKQKKDALLNAAFQLFLANGLTKTTISDIVDAAGVAKGTFYLYFEDKYDIRNKLISHKAGQLFTAAYSAVQEKGNLVFDERIIFIVDYIVDELTKDKPLLKFLSKNLSWGVFKTALIAPLEEEEEVNFYEVYLKMIENSGHEILEPEIMLFLIIELVESSIYSSILENEPVSIEKLKPHLYDTIRYILKSHRK